MYKDVWKKFGWKMLIAVCSVLLLGGVAFAAPRLQAEEASLSIGDVTFSTEKPESGPAIYIDDEEKKKISYRVSDDGTPENVYPLKLQYLDENGDEHTLLKDIDYTVSGPQNANRAGDNASVNIMYHGTGGYFKTDASTLQITYKINKCLVSSIGGEMDVSVRDGYLKAGADSRATLRPGDLLVQLKRGGKSDIEIREGEYNLVGSASYTKLGSQPFEVSFDNYEYDPSQSNYKGIVWVKKWVGDLQVYCDGDHGGRILVTDYVGAQDKPPQNITVSDGAIAVTEEQVSRTIAGAPGGSQGVKLKAQDSSNYYGEHTFLYHVKAKPFLPQLPEDWPEILEYDETSDNGRGYIKIPQSLRNKANPGDILMAGRDYKKLTEDDFSIVERGDSDQVIEGATAGMVRINVTGIGEYVGSTIPIYYYVKRSLENDKVTVRTIPPRDELQTAYVYGDGKKEHKPELELSFDDSPDGILKQGRDFNVTYSNALRRNSKGEKPVASTEEAGTVSMHITGTAINAAGGYYGEINLNDYYPVNPKKISAEDGYKLNLDPSSKNPGKLFYTGTKVKAEDIAAKAVVEYNDETSIKISGLEQEKDYRIYFLDSEGRDIDAPVECGDYQVEYWFFGNYDGKLRADFTIAPLEAKDCRIVIGKCDRESEPGHHVYDQRKHEPQITVKYTNRETGEDIEIPISSSDITYGENTELGTGTVTVKLPGGQSKTEEFTITNTELKDEKIELPEEYKRKGDGSKEHDYAGKSRWPSLKTVKINGVELTEGEDYTVEALCIADGGEAVDASTYPKIKKNYKFKIKGLGGYVGEAYTELFCLRQKSIADASVVYNNLDRSNLGENEGEYVKRELEVTDSEFGDELVYGQDYTLEVTDQIEKNGTVKVIIKEKEGSCYKGQKEFTYNVGRDISETIIMDKNSVRVDKPQADGHFWLKSSYSTPASPASIEYNVPFAEEDGNMYQKVYLVDGSTPLYKGSGGGKQYEVTFVAGSEIDTAEGEKLYAIAILTGKNGYYGTREIYFYVEQKTLRGADIKIITQSAIDLTYSGYPIEPKIEVRDAGGNPVDARDYSVKWRNNVDAGEATVIVTGKRAYTESVSMQFTIEKRNLNDEACIWVEGNEGRYKYRETTTEGGHTIEGVRPEVQVWFDPDGHNKNGPIRRALSVNVDYTITYANNTNVWVSGSDKDKKDGPKIVITATDKNFTGSITEYFDITAVDLATECKVTVVNEKSTVFNGLEQKPDVRVVRSGSNITVSPNQYDVSYTSPGSLFVSGVLDTEKPKVIVKAKETGNYIGSQEVPYTIYGNLSPTDTKQATNSAIEWKINAIPYSEGGNYNLADAGSLTFKEKKEGITWNGGGSSDKSEVNLVYDEDYTIRADTSKVGSHVGTITGKGRFFGVIERPVVILGDLSASYTTYNELGDIAIDGDVGDVGKYLSDLLDIKCGGKDLVYKKDYKFENEERLSMDLKPHTVDVIPTETAKYDPENNPTGYLTGTLRITYTVKQGIEGFHIEGLKLSYEYKHGDSVITKDDFKVYASKADVPSGSALHYGDDYEISEESQLKERDEEGHLIILGKGKYAGRMDYYFDITRYDLAQHYEDNELNITYNKKPEYSGTQISAKELEVEIKTSDGKYTIDPEEYNVVVKSDSGADYVNRTKEGDVDPVFKIVSRENNYTGEIDDAKELSFKIQPKVLTADLFSIPSEVEYHEKDTEPPVPKGMYNGIPLRGERYRTDVTDYDDICDFSYTYEPTDTKTGGVKAVKITGYGNFSGTVSLEYTVTKKDISSSDIVLTLTTPEPYIYNGHEQTPAFELTYEGETILVYDGQKASVTRLLNPIVTYSDNENAGTGIIQIKAQENDPNYTGQKDYTFTIEPLPIDNHISFLWGSEGKNLASFKLELPRDGQEWTADGGSYIPKHLASKEETGALPEDNNSYVRVYYNDSAIKDLELYGVNKADYNADAPVDYTIDRYYVEPDTDDTRIREEYDNQDFINAGKVKVTITGTGNYTGTACYWYYIGTDISAEGASSLQKTTTVFNAQQQWPVEVVSGLDASKYRIVRYRHAVTEENILGEKPVKDKDGGDTKAFIDADTYYIRIEGKPEAGTYSSKPIQLTYTILPRSINRVLIDGYKAEYQYTGSAVCPAGLTVTDPIDEIRYKLTENKDYTISYSNNINAGVASIIIKGQGNYDSGTTATARFTITSSTISSGSSGGNGGGSSAGSSDGSSGQLAGPSSAISADDVRLTMDTSDAMYYTGSAVYPGVYISGMTENIDYTVTFSNNINVGQGIVTIRGINNSSGVITKTFRIIGDLAKCSVAAIPDQAYTGLAVTPGVTVTCGTNTLLQGTDYTLSYANNINIGTASVVITAARDSNYVGSVTVNFSIGNGISSAVVSGYASHYTYTGEPITPAVSVAAGSATLRAGTDYTVEYADNTNAGTATMTITGKGVYSGTQKVTFVIEPKSIASCTTTDVSGKKYTGDAYTPAVTVSDGGKTLTNGVDYTVTYANNTNPGVASIIIRALNDNYTGTKTINFRIGTVAVSNFHAGNIKSTSMTLAWTAQDYASGYQICDANSRVVKNSTKNKVTLTGLTSGKTYKYKVRSFIRRADGTRAYGSFSTVISATTKLKTPAVKAASTGKNKARVRWSKVTGATGYQIYYSKSATKGFKKLKTTKNTVRTLNIKGLSSGQRYFFRVRAYKRVGSKNIYSNYNSLKAITVK